MTTSKAVSTSVTRGRLQAMEKRRRYGANGVNKAPTPETMDARSSANDSAKVILQKFCDGDFDGAEAYLEERVKTFRLTSTKAFYHSIIIAFARAGAADAAVWCAVRMVRTGFRPNVVTFNSLLDASAKVGDLKLAEYVWQVMVEYGIKPNDITFNTMINVCCQAKDADAAEQWMEKMQQEGLEPGAVSYSALMAAFAKTGQAEKAEIWYERMRQANVDADGVIFNAMLDAASKAALTDVAERWLVQMMEAGIPPKKKTFNRVIQACAKHGDIERAEYWMQRMEQTCRADKTTFASLVHASIKAGDIPRAEFWIGALGSRGLDATTSIYNDVLHHAFESRNDYHGAVRWYAKMIQDGIQPNRATFNRIINICERTNPSATQAWIREMTSLGYQAPCASNSGSGGRNEVSTAVADEFDDEFDDGVDARSDDRTSASGTFTSPTADVVKFPRFFNVPAGLKIPPPPGLEPPAEMQFQAAKDAPCFEAKRAQFAADRPRGDAESQPQLVRMVAGAQARLSPSFAAYPQKPQQHAPAISGMQTPMPQTAAANSPSGQFRMVGSCSPGKQDYHNGVCEDVDSHTLRGGFRVRRMAGPVRPRQDFQQTCNEVLSEADVQPRGAFHGRRVVGPLRPGEHFQQSCNELPQGPAQPQVMTRWTSQYSSEYSTDSVERSLHQPFAQGFDLQGSQTYMEQGSSFNSFDFSADEQDLVFYSDSQQMYSHPRPLGRRY